MWSRFRVRELSLCLQNAPVHGLNHFLDSLAITTVNLQYCPTILKLLKSYLYDIPWYTVILFI